MPPRDTIHASVKHALMQDGWDITDDPLQLIVVNVEQMEVQQWIPPKSIAI